MHPYSRTELLLGKEALARLRQARVAVFGLGGVGGYAVEALARSGVGTLELVDHDTVSLTNLNRQILATHSTLGQYKVDVAKARIADIDPQIRVTARKVFFTPETTGQFDFKEFDYVIDAIDTVTGKLALIQCAQEAHTPIICAMGTGNKLDPTAFRVGDLYETSACPLARIMRKECRKRGIPALKVVYSTELPHTPIPDSEIPRPVPGSCAFVPPTAGLILAGAVIRDLIGQTG